MFAYKIAEPTMKQYQKLPGFIIIEMIWFDNAN